MSVLWGDDAWYKGTNCEKKNSAIKGGNVFTCRFPFRLTCSAFQPLKHTNTPTHPHTHPPRPLVLLLPRYSCTWSLALLVYQHSQSPWEQRLLSEVTLPWNYLLQKGRNCSLLIFFRIFCFVLFVISLASTLVQNLDLCLRTRFLPELYTIFITCLI